MCKKNKSTLIRYGMIFAIVPIVATYLFGHAFKIIFANTIESAAGLPLDDPDRIFLPQVEYIFPFAILSGLAAFTVWCFLLHKQQTPWRGLWAGVFTVFICHPVVGFAIGLTYPGSTTKFASAFDASISLTIAGHILTSWLTYPICAIYGFIVAEKLMKASMPSDADKTSEVFK